MNLAQSLNQAASVLRDAGIDSPRREARLLLAHALGVDPAALVGREWEERAAPGFAALLARRAAREPLALILGRQGFWSLELAVSPATLIPRADSETLIEAALEALPARAAVRRVLDLGTGTGCLLLAALREFPAAWGLGVERVPAAATLARANAASLGLASRCGFVIGDWAAALGGEFDLVLSNPPYIRAADIAGLMPEVARHEPASALDGGPDGLDAYRVVTAQVAALLAAEGVAVLELGEGQAEPVTRLAEGAGLRRLALRADLGGVPRALVLCRAG